MEENLKLLLDALHRALDEQRKSLETYADKLDDVRAALERQGLYTLPAGSLVGKAECREQHGGVVKECDEFKATVSNRLKAAWIIITFVLGGYGFAIWYAIDWMVNHP